MKTLLAILSIFTLTALVSSTIVEVKCSTDTSQSGVGKIEYTLEGELNKKDDQLKITIKDYPNLTNVKVVSSNGDILGIQGPDANGVITVIANANTGSATITITADDKQPLKIEIAINTKYEIQASLDKTTLKIGESAILTIQDHTLLTGLKIIGSPNGIVQIGSIQNDGTVTIKASTEGTLTLTITATNAFAPKKFDLTVQPKISIEASIDNQTPEINDTVNLHIDNFNQLVNVQIKADQSGSVEIGTIDSQGNSAIKILKGGSIIISVSADNATSVWTGTITVQSKVNIQARIDKNEIWTQNTAIISITNFSELHNVQLQANPSANVQIGTIDSQGNVEITGINAGNVVITINADNANDPLDLNLLVKPRITIQATIDNNNLKVGQDTNIRITNPSQLENLSIVGNPSENIEMGTISSDGTVKVKALKSGTVSFNISADNGISTTLELSIAALIPIDASVDETQLWVGESTILTIKNFDQLINVKAVADANNTVELGPIDNDGKTTIKALKSGQVTITITADNAQNSKQIALNIQNLIPIDATIDKTELKIGESATISITNIQQFENLKISADVNDAIEIGTIGSDGKTTIKALKSGQVTITITADNGISKTFTLKIGDRIDINASISDSNLWIDKTATLTITNFTDLVNLQVKASGSGNVQLGNINGQGQIIVTATTVGTVAITISADNAIENKIINLNITAKINIDATIDKTTIWAGETATITINNFNQLVNPKISASPNGIVQLGNINPDGTVNVQAISIGAVIITVSADNGISKTLNLTINNKITINATIDKTTIWTGETATVTITNPGQFTNLQISASPNGIVQLGNINPDGTVNVQAISAGTAIITISADNGITKTLNVTINNKITINATIDKTNLRVGETATVTITNPAQFTNLQISASPNGIIQLGNINPDGTVNVQAIGSGTAVITISADNGITKTLNVTIANKIAIQASLDKNSLWIGDSGILTIANFNQLVNLQVNASPGGNVQLGTIDGQGQITVTGLAAGTTAITINAANATTPVVLNVTISAKLPINATIDKTTIRVGEKATLTITNFANLTNLKVTPNPTGIVQLSAINAQGQITVTGLAAGSTTLTITADNGITATFNITVPSLVTIIASANPTSIPILGISTITITNIAQLVGVTATIINGSSLVIINTGDITKGKITITALSLPGSITVRLAATNAVAPVDIVITIRLL